ncbi:hypothetical protein ACQ4PT_065923 [Festuca glaucescens]
MVQRHLRSEGHAMDRHLATCTFDEYQYFDSEALKEAIEVFCNKGVSGSSSDELLATFCDNILKIGFGEKIVKLIRKGSGNSTGFDTVLVPPLKISLAKEVWAR